MRLARRLIGVLLVLLLLGLSLAVYGFSVALSDPVVRRAEVALADWPEGERPRTVLLISDVHVVAPDMPPERVARIVDRMNALDPDLIVLTGDFISQKWGTRHYTPAEIVAQLARLRARLGVVAVLGNHDHHGDAAAFRRAFAASPIALLDNGAVRRGPFRVGGVDDYFTGHPNVPAMENALALLGDGPALVLSHNPDILPLLSGPTDAILAGHTHCGQIAIPFYGPLATMSLYGRRFACGRIVDSGRLLFVSAGLGTSLMPVRLGVPPDVWLIRFGPARR